MSQNIFNIPPEIYQGEIPPDYRCTMYVGRMVGKLSPLQDNPNFKKFDFEIHDALDPTEMVLRYTTMEAPASELARWENVGDVVGIVIASNEKDLEMVLAYNFTRRKWFSTGYYPHVRDTGIHNKLTVDQIRQYTMLCVPFIFVCGVGCIGLPIMIYLGVKKTQQYKVLNPTDFRGATAKKIADWITANAANLARSGNPAIDPSL